MAAVLWDPGELPRLLSAQEKIIQAQPRGPEAALALAGCLPAHHSP